MRTLIVEDDPDVSGMLQVALRKEGHIVEHAATGQDALWMATEFDFDVVVLDWELPSMDGIEVCQALRDRGRWMPIIMVTANREVDQRVTGLRAGADDYLTKPFGIGELLARLRVAERHLAARSGAPGDAIVRIGDVSLDLSAHRVTRGGAELHLTPIEYELLTALAKHRGKVLTHRQLLREVWGAAHVESPQYLRIYMRALRQKIEDDPARPRWLLTEVGVGYRLADET